MTRKPVDVWLKFSDDLEEELAEYEANTYRDDDGFVIEWYHNDVGVVTSVYCNTYTAVVTWYETKGYQDFTDYTDEDQWDMLTGSELAELTKTQDAISKAQASIKEGLAQ